MILAVSFWPWIKLSGNCVRGRHFSGIKEMWVTSTRSVGRWKAWKALKKGCWGSICSALLFSILSITMNYFYFVWKDNHDQVVIIFNPFTPESDQCQNSPAASQEIWHHTVWRTWLFIAYWDEKWLYYKFSLHHSYNRFLKGWEKHFLSSGVKGLMLWDCSSIVKTK